MHIDWYQYEHKQISQYCATPPLYNYHVLHQTSGLIQSITQMEHLTQSVTQTMMYMPVLKHRKTARKQGKDFDVLV